MRVINFKISPNSTKPGTWRICTHLADSHYDDPKTDDKIPLILYLNKELQWFEHSSAFDSFEECCDALKNCDKQLFD